MWLSRTARGSHREGENAAATQRAGSSCLCACCSVQYTHKTFLAVSYICLYLSWLSNLCVGSKKKSAWHPLVWIKDPRTDLGPAQVQGSIVLRVMVNTDWWRPNYVELSCYYLIKVHSRGTLSKHQSICGHKVLLNDEVGVSFLA